ncbi:MAG: hypothetical protein M0Q37_03085 [Sphaerochaeta sp.]|nr:hypothetical protein [Sphaerochaeta sp.]
MNYIEAVREQLARYPQSALGDLYKSFFQDSFGPGHLLDDLGQTRLSFERELAAMQSRGRWASEPCGLGRNFHRIPMDLIVDGIVDREEYYDSFLASARSFTLPDIVYWREEWQTILEALRPLEHQIKDFGADEKRIASLLQRRSYVSDHSSHYRRLYDPHYRIFTTIEARRLLKDM